MALEDVAGPTWTFLTNHAHVLNCIADDPESRLRDIAARVGITERAAQAIVSDLEAGGYLTRTRAGRRIHMRCIRICRFVMPSSAIIRSVSFLTSWG